MITDKPSFDTWTIIFLFAAIQGLFIGMTFLFKKSRHISAKILGVIPMLFSLTLLEYVLFWTHYVYRYPQLINISICTLFLFGPLFYLYFKSIFSERRLDYKALYHFVPFAIVFLWLSSFLFKTAHQKQIYILQKHTVENYHEIEINWLGIVQMIIYCIVIFRDFNALSKINPEIKKWFQWVNSLFLCYILSYLSYFILSRFSFFNVSWDYAISLSMMFFIFFISWFGYQQPKVFDGFDLFEIAKSKYQNSPISKEIGKQIIDKLQLEMQAHKYYRVSDINLEKLAKRIDTNKHYLSQAINENLNINFFEYINLLRIEEAKKMLDTDENLTIIEIAYEVGYNNKVSFNKAFKNNVGQTPSAYRNAREMVNV